MEIKRILIRCAIFALLGMFAEVTHDVIRDLIRLGDWRLAGRFSLWMIPDYALLGIMIMPLSAAMKARGIVLPARALVYMVGIFAIEYVSGLILNSVLHLHVWDYSRLPLTLHGQITLCFAPLWYALGLGAEFLHRKVDAVAIVLAHNKPAEQVSG